MIEPRQGEARWADASEPFGRRPVLVLTRSAVIPHLSNVTVAPLTTRVRHVQSEVLLGKADGLIKPCAVSLENIQTFPKNAIDARIAVLSKRKMLLVWEAIRFAFDMP